jgi:hypothetical protein
MSCDPITQHYSGYGTRVELTTIGPTTIGAADPTCCIQCYFFGGDDSNHFEWYQQQSQFRDIKSFDIDTVRTQYGGIGNPYGRPASGTVVGWYSYD